MRIFQWDAEKVVIALDPDEAGRLLADLGSRAAVLGDTGAELARRLQQAGVTPPSAPVHARHEYMPPD